MDEMLKIQNSRLTFVSLLSPLPPVMFMALTTVSMATSNLLLELVVMETNSEQNVFVSSEQNSLQKDKQTDRQTDRGRGYCTTL